MTDSLVQKEVRSKGRTLTDISVAFSFKVVFRPGYSSLYTSDHVADVDDSVVT